MLSKVIKKIQDSASVVFQLFLKLSRNNKLTQITLMGKRLYASLVTCVPIQAGPSGAHILRRTHRNSTHTYTHHNQ